jgi:8-oxo-dGTP diphosphatase
MNRQISVALTRQNDAVLLVRQSGHDDPEPYWALPGGIVERGETLLETLVREVYEETGLRVIAVRQLIYLAQTVSPGSQSTAFVFEVESWRGNLHVHGDGFVSEAAFVPVNEAIARLKAISYRNMREPIVAYLSGDVSAGAMWLYRLQKDGSRELVTCLASNFDRKGHPQNAE